MKTFCRQCTKEINVRPCVLKNSQNGAFCSKPCFALFRIGTRFSEKHKRKLKEARKHRVGKLAPSWKGDDAGYSAIHCWVRKIMGNPITCKECNIAGEKIGRRWNLEWANISGEYKRNLADWVGLCKKCHSKFDEIGEGRKRNFAGQFI